MELRKDYILDRWVYLAEERSKRPSEFVSSETKDSKACFFCAGNESMTPEEIGRVKNKNSWLIRWFVNKFPAVALNEQNEIKTDNTFFTYSGAFGKHEIIADTPNHNEQLWDLGREHFSQLLKVYVNRIDALSSINAISYVQLFKNHGREGGASLAHSHTQVVGMGFYPPSIREEILAIKEFGSCAYCRIIEIEKKSLRRCFENNSFVAFTPYASRFNFEVWVFPKKHMSSFSALSGQEYLEMADIMKSILSKLKSINTPYNFFIHYSKDSDGLHAHIEVTPRLSLWAGFEHSSGVVINSVTPEFAASFFRGEI